MKRSRIILVLTMLAVMTTLGTATASSGGPGLVVSTQWLADHLNDQNLVILHANWTSPSYKKGHIPGARFLWINSLSKDTPERNTEVPSLSDGAKVLKNLGVTDQSKIVVYFEGQNMTMSARMILTLSYLGLGDRVSLLDGGLDAWKSEGRPVTKEVPTIQPGNYVPKLHPEVIADADWIKKHLDDAGITIIDARVRRFYDGSAGTPPGHIPHALSIPFSSVADSTNKMLAPDVLRQVFDKAGVKPGTRLVTYCHVGQQASLVYLAARMIGYDVRVYDGSFEDWSDRELPVESPQAKK